MSEPLSNKQPHNEPLTNNASWLRVLVRTVNLLGMLGISTVVFGNLFTLADAHAAKIANYDLAHPGMLAGWTLIAGGALPLLTIVLYVVTLVLILQRYKIK
jgi:hypothetical protein